MEAADLPGRREASASEVSELTFRPFGNDLFGLLAYL
jgi:hypothetical protein